ncbi:hypothetical protein JVU11DRAFT_5666 [Chiua virens]|nr:hypothetical protein JVU11DRAFT_5666 [Chiua virens]
MPTTISMSCFNAMQRTASKDIKIDSEGSSGEPLSLLEHYAFTMHHQAGSSQCCQNQDLADVIEVTISMKVMVTQNI